MKETRYTESGLCLFLVGFTLYFIIFPTKWRHQMIYVATYLISERKGVFSLVTFN